MNFGFSASERRGAAIPHLHYRLEWKWQLLKSSGGPQPRKTDLSVLNFIVFWLLIHLLHPLAFLNFQDKYLYQW